jgi:CRP-like cAMP-binding protein
MPNAPDSLLPFLRKLEERASFTPDEREAILRLPFTPRQIEANRDFIERGQRVSNSCFVLEGMVGTFGQNRQGIRQITSVFMRGEMIDLQSVVLPEAMASIQAVVTSTILQVPHAALRDVSHRFPNLADAFWRECVLDAAIINEWVVNVGRRDARSAMAHLFCELACRSGRATPQAAFRFPFPFTQHQFGDMLGLTPVHVNRTLKGLREDRLIEINHRAAEILDWDELVRIGDFDANYLQLGAKDGALSHSPPRTQLQASPIQLNT